MWAAATLAISILRSVLALFRSRQDQAIVELALRQQLAVYAHWHRRPRLSPLDRAFWVALSRFWPRWRTALTVVQPETVIRWHREGFRRYWRSISMPGRPTADLGRHPATHPSDGNRKSLARSLLEDPASRWGGFFGFTVEPRRARLSFGTIRPRPAQHFPGWLAVHQHRIQHPLAVA